jgi:hypothetical protein
MKIKEDRGSIIFLGPTRVRNILGFVHPESYVNHGGRF